MNNISQKLFACVDSLSPELFSFIQTLVQTPSLSGKEQEIQELIAAKLKNLNLEVDIVPSILRGT